MDLVAFAKAVAWMTLRQAATAIVVDGMSSSTSPQWQSQRQRQRLQQIASLSGSRSAARGMQTPPPSRGSLSNGDSLTVAHIRGNALVDLLAKRIARRDQVPRAQEGQDWC